MGFSKCFILPLLLVSVGCSQLVNSQQQTPQQQQPQSQHPQIVPQHQPQHIPVSHQSPSTLQENVISTPLDNSETQITNHYPYQANSLPPNSGYHQAYPSSNYGSRDVSPGWSNQQGWSNPYFGVSTGTAWELTAYFGPVFWAFVAIIATFGFCVGVSRFILGGDIFGGMFQRIKDSAPSGKSLDLDNITNIVYQALDTYGKYAAKEARYASTESVKG